MERSSLFKKILKLMVLIVFLVSLSIASGCGHWRGHGCCYKHDKSKCCVEQKKDKCCCVNCSEKCCPDCKKRSECSAKDKEGMKEGMK